MASDSGTSFTANLSRGMHAAAQPLAILRARFYPELIQQMKKDELLELAMSSTEQIERVCTLFGYLQQLVTAESIAPRPVEVQISRLLEDAVESVELWFQDSGMTLTCDPGKVLKPVIADRQRTMQALSAGLMIAHSFSTKGDAVTLTAVETENGVEMTLRNPTSNPAMLSAEANLGLAVAEAQMRSQGGSVTHGLQPFQITMTLPRTS